MKKIGRSQHWYWGYLIAFDHKNRLTTVEKDKEVKFHLKDIPEIDARKLAIEWIDKYGYKAL